MAGVEGREEIFHKVRVGAELVDFVLLNHLGEGFGLCACYAFEAVERIRGGMAGQENSRIFGFVYLFNQKESHRSAAVSSNKAKFYSNPQNVYLFRKQRVHFLPLLQIGKHLTFVKGQRFLFVRTSLLLLFFLLAF